MTDWECKKIVDPQGRRENIIKPFAAAACTPEAQRSIHRSAVQTLQRARVNLQLTIEPSLVMFLGVQ